jgi:hypothetical protein
MDYEVFLYLCSDFLHSHGVIGRSGNMQVQRRKDDLELNVKA